MGEKQEGFDVVAELPPYIENLSKTNCIFQRIYA